MTQLEKKIAEVEAAEDHSLEMDISKHKLQAEQLPTLESPSRIISSKDFIKDFKPERWLIKDVLPSGEFGEMFGASGSRKTFMALDMATCIHNGIDWHSKEVKQGNVLYICGEAVNGVRMRLSAFERHYNTEESMHVLPTSIDMMKEDSLQMLSDDIAKIDGNYSLIVIDTLNANFTGEENDAGDFAVMKSNLQKHLGRDNRLILWIHHTGNSEGKRGRGSSARFAGIDVSLQIVKNEKFSVLSNTKQKDAEAFEDMSFAFASVDTGFCEEDGTPLFSLVPKVDGDGAVKAITKVPAYHDEIATGIRLALKENKGVIPSKKFIEMFSLRPEENVVLHIETAKEYAYKMFDSTNKTVTFNRWLTSAKRANIAYFYDDFILLANDAKLTKLTKMNI